MKKIMLILFLISIITMTFALSPQEAAFNQLMGNQLRQPLMLGEYNTGIIFTKQNPLDDYWLACFPIKHEKYNYQCTICRGCN